MRKTLLLALPAILLASALGGCASTGSSGNFQAAPVGVGGGPDRLKRTPCACLKLRNKPGLPSHLVTGAADHKA